MSSVFYNPQLPRTGKEHVLRCPALTKHGDSTIAEVVKNGPHLDHDRCFGIDPFAHHNLGHILQRSPRTVRVSWERPQEPRLLLCGASARLTHEHYVFGHADHHGRGVFQSDDCVRGAPEAFSLDALGVAVVSRPLNAKSVVGFEAQVNELRLL